MNQSTSMMNRKLRVVLTTLLFTTGLVQAQTQSQTTVFTKNAQGQMASVTDAMGNKVDYQYDALGNLVRTNAAGSVTSLQYDVRGNKIAMQDPAMGSWTYGYNAFGELVTQRDSLNQTTAMAYDLLGRMTKRTEPDLVSDWSYDQKFDGTGCGKGVGKLCEAKTDNNYKRTHTYDSMGRLGTTATVLDSVASPATVSESFDVNTGRVATKTWPTGYQVSYSYTPLGYLSSVSGGGTTSFPQSTSYQILGMTPHGQVTKYRTGNQVTVINTYDPLVERLVGQTGTTDGQTAGNVINQAYRFNALGNLLARLDNTPGVGTQESFSYDSLNRLTTATILGGAVSPPTSTEVMYDTRGNITYKSDVGRYWYDAARPNRMTNVTLETAPGATVPLSGTRALSYAFDDGVVNAQSVNGTTVGNGNLTYTVSRDTVNNIHTVRFESYTSFNMPAQIVYGNYVTNTSSTSDRTLSFLYGPEHQRIKQNVALSGNGTSAYFSGNTWYLNGEDSLGLTYEKEVRSNGTTEHKHYLTAQGTTFALFISRTGTLNGLPATTTSYFHKDQMGSIAAITDATGAVTERLAYDPWGKRRFVNSTPGLTDKLDAIVGVKTDRGYTEHEHLDEVGVIHMNGRIYDPLMGRFMSADPTVQAPYNLKSFNRYSYVWNNPLVMFDPTGYSAYHDSYSGSGYGSSNAENGSNPSDSSGVGGVSNGFGGQVGGNSGNSAVSMVNTYFPPMPVAGPPTQVAMAGVAVPPIVITAAMVAATTEQQKAAMAKALVDAYNYLKNGIKDGVRTLNEALGVNPGAKGPEEQKETNTVPPEVKDKIPSEWGEGAPNRKGDGIRWQDPNDKGSGVRVDAGDPNNSQPSQQVDHVIVRDKGVVIGRDGKPIKGSIKQDPTNAHIPLSEYKNWRSWNKP